MISVKKAYSLVKDMFEGGEADNKLLSVFEYEDCYTFEYGDIDPQTGEALPLITGGPTKVDKRTGRVDLFFPPDYSAEYLDSGKEIPLSEVV